MSRIVFVNRFFYPDHSATSQMLTDLAFHLAEQSHQVTVIAGRQLYGNPGDALPASERVRGVKIHRVWSTRFGRARLLGRALDYFTFYLSAAAALLRHLHSGDLVVAKTDPPLISVVAAGASALTGARLINWTQDLFPEVASALDVAGVNVVERGLKGLRNRACLMAEWNVVIGERMADRLRREGIPADSIRVIHNWADARAVRPIPHGDNPLRRQWNLEGKFVIGYSGNLGRAHEFETIVQAAERLSCRPSIRFLFIGDGAQLALLQEEVERRGLLNVIFRPYQPRERLAYSLSVSDLHVVSLRPGLEGLIVPSKFYGIAAAGRPVLFLGSADGEIAQILQQHRCGFCVGIGELEQTVSHIERLANDEVECRRLGKAARTALETYYEKHTAFKAWNKTLSVSRRAA